MIASNPQEKELPDHTKCWALVEEVAASTHFKRAARLRELLLYINRRGLIDGCAQIREQEIGAAVFERPGGYDTSVDTIVRVSASELRKRIDAYFSSEGLHHQLIMEIPRGSYIPIFRNRPVETPIIAESPALQSPAIGNTEVTPAVQSATGQRRWMLAGLIVSLLAIGGCAALWIQNHNLRAQNRAINETMNDWRYHPAVATLWSGFLGSANRVTDVVMSDESLLLIQSSTKRVTTFDDYLNRNYLSQILDQDSDSSVKSVLSTIGSKTLVSSNELRLAQRIVALDPLNKKIHLYDAREYAPDLLKEDNVILIGSQYSNPWAGLFGKNLNFSRSVEDNGSAGVINHAPRAGEEQIYKGTVDNGYCLVAYLPNPAGEGKLLLIEGTSAEATEAAGDFILSESQLSSFLKTLHLAKLPYFEVVLKTSEVRGTPFNATVEAYRTYPNLH